MNNQKLLKAKGFTLVELLIVVIILALLAAIVIPQFASSTDDAKIASLDTSLVREIDDGDTEHYHQRLDRIHQTSGFDFVTLTELTKLYLLDSQRLPIRRQLDFVPQPPLIRSEI